MMKLLKNREIVGGILWRGRGGGSHPQAPVYTILEKNIPERQQIQNSLQTFIK